jgi:formyl-CoA transferase
MHPLLGPLRQLANPVHLGGQCGGSVRSAPPLLGEHSIEVLTDFGWNDGAIQGLLAREVIFAARSQSDVAQADEPLSAVG